MPKWEAESELPGDESRQKTTHQNFREEYYTEKFLCVVRSTQIKHVKCSACFFSSWDFSVAHGGMYDVEQRVNLKHHINKGKAMGSTLKISRFMGFEALSSQHFDIIQAETLFTNFFVALSSQS